MLGNVLLGTLGYLSERVGESNDRIVGFSENENTMSKLGYEIIMDLEDRPEDTGGAGVDDSSPSPKT